MAWIILAMGTTLACVLVSALAYNTGTEHVLDDLRDAAYRIGELEAMARILNEAERAGQDQPVESSDPGS